MKKSEAGKREGRGERNRRETDEYVMGGRVEEESGRRAIGSPTKPEFKPPAQGVSSFYVMGG